MRKSLILITCVLVFILISVFLPTTEAETFKIGKKISESDLDDNSNKLIYFDSGIVTYSYSDYIDYIPLIFDGNKTTGIDHNFGPSHGWMNIDLMFPYAFYINNITVLPMFNGSTSNYSLNIHYGGANVPGFAHEISTQKVFHINCTIYGVRIELSNGNTNHFYFNDIIIQYTPSSSNNNNNLQKQINKINQDINSFYNDITVLKSDIIGIKENITNIKNNIPSEYNDSALQDKINNLTKEINSLKENLTKINNSIPMEYNDSAIKSNIFIIETENIFLKQQIGNLTIRINNITTELGKLSSEVQNLQSVGSAEDGDSEKNDRLYQYRYNILFGVIIIILLLIILGLSMMVLKKKEQPLSKPTLENGIYSNVMHEILFDNKQQNAKRSNDELNIALENKHRKGDMSEKTYNSLKDLIQNLDNAQQKKK